MFVNRVKVYLNSFTDPKNNPARRKYDVSIPCAVCKLKGHDFDGCGPLKDNEFLRDAVIKSSLFFSNETKRHAALVKASIERQKSVLTSRQNQLEATLNSIDAMYSESDSDTEFDYKYDQIYFKPDEKDFR